MRRRRGDGLLQLADTARSAQIRETDDSISYPLDKTEIGSLVPYVSFFYVLCVSVHFVLFNFPAAKKSVELSPKSSPPSPSTEYRHSSSRRPTRRYRDGGLRLLLNRCD